MPFFSNFFRGFAALLLLAALTGCMETQQRLQTAADHNVLSYTIGKSYAEVASQKALDDLLLRNKAYGEMISQTALPDGDMLYRHAKPVEAVQSDFNVGGLIGRSKTRYNYSLFYFRVGSDGLIKDYANGVLPGSDVSCMTYLGDIFRNCEDAQLLSNDIARLDAAVRTSSGQTLASWQ
jgi:hypothetical protein